MTVSVKPAGPNYTVKDVETIAAGKDVRARLYTLAPGEVIPWHSRSEIADHFFILGGELTVETRKPGDCRTRRQHGGRKFRKHGGEGAAPVQKLRLPVGMANGLRDLKQSRWWQTSGGKPNLEVVAQDAIKIFALRRRSNRAGLVGARVAFRSGYCQCLSPLLFT